MGEPSDEVQDDGRVICRPHPDHPGWMLWALHPEQPQRFNGVLGELLMRREDDGRVCVRMMPGAPHSNFNEVVHGGATLTFIDIAIYAAAWLEGLLEGGQAVTVDLSTQFVGAGRIGEPLDALVERVRETRHLLFLRGLVVQGDDVVSNFHGMLKKTKPTA